MRTRCKYARAAVSCLSLVSENEAAVKGKQNIQLGQWMVTLLAWAWLLSGEGRTGTRYMFPLPSSQPPLLTARASFQKAGAVGKIDVQGAPLFRSGNS